MTAGFVYVEDPGALADEPGVFTARIGVTEGKEELLDAVAAALRFPGYFGRNWDALEECLRDLSWIGERRVRIVHAAVPAFGVYLEILRDICAEWARGGEKRSEAVFPASGMREVERLMGPG